MPKYKILNGKHAVSTFDKDTGKRVSEKVYKAGDTLEISDATAQAFPGRFEKAAVAAAEPKAAPKEGDKAPPAGA